MSETMGRCRSEVDSYRKPEFHYAAIADAIDRLAADVAAIKAKVDAVSPEDVKHFVESEKAWVKLVEEQRDAAIRERDEARAEVVTAMEQRGIAVMQRDAAITRRDDAEAEVERLEAKLAARRSMAPVVKVPAMPLEVGDANTHTGQYQRGRRDTAVSYRAALDKAGVAWKEVPRE